ncbi:MAG TPA: alpha-amylase [Lachnospiraceae bacterium]|jgi:isoamylase|nr:alpha-amylase [Lachnospiraceae bacterium]
MKTEKKKIVKAGMPYPLGVSKTVDGIQFTAEIRGGASKQCELRFFDDNIEKKDLRIDLHDFNITGDIFSILIFAPDLEQYEYQYQVDGKPYIDPYSMAVADCGRWGDTELFTRNNVKSRINNSLFDWKDDKSPQLAYEDVIMYSLHVRGFTKHTASGVTAKGTFQGIVEKIPYFLELGINQIELLPAYEFKEIQTEADEPQDGRPNYTDSQSTYYKLNYWGFTEGLYFIPKAAYAYTNDPVNEFKSMVYALHQAGIEIIMQFYFPPKVNRNVVLDCLKYWIAVYHIDGFHLKGEKLPISLIATNPLFIETKIYCHDFDIVSIFGREPLPEYKNLAEYSSGFMYDMRRFLKSDEDMIQAFAYRLRRIPRETGVINYITEYEGFTLYDLVSYDFKHNEANGEENRDGNNYNYSWNCGIEGDTRKKAVLELRKKQMKNALIFLLLSQGTPMLLAGDELANTQLGNNNPYCQDNSIAWLQWKKNKFSCEIQSFVKALIRLRKQHPIMRNKSELRIMDYISCGYPDLSYHGEAAWYPNFDNHIRYIGVMLCGKYAKIDRRQDDDFFYFAYNMHWDVHKFGLPKLPKGMKWYLKIDTGSSDKNSFLEDGAEILLPDQENLIVTDRTIVVLIGR